MTIVFLKIFTRKRSKILNYDTKKCPLFHRFWYESEKATSYIFVCIYLYRFASYNFKNLLSIIWILILFRKNNESFLLCLKQKFLFNSKSPLNFISKLSFERQSMGRFKNCTVLSPIFSSLRIRDIREAFVFLRSARTRRLEIFLKTLSNQRIQNRVQNRA